MRDAVEDIRSSVDVSNIDWEENYCDSARNGQVKL